MEENRKLNKIAGKEQQIMKNEEKNYGTNNHKRTICVKGEVKDIRVQQIMVFNVDL